ncbi:ShlB/FhaC/HecB family hemolysin secretion/activation protein [Microbulbifer salipaludis]|uniref:ShlB/FhaC/HecB family hemolysin secretion/activation protein n=2 Tax=Microbulbifer salipaludis TaxID=187980 RepID=A0ABS3E3L8_9GAMM|nr:ShlB/FhaC/HecB family hemolysin secretion/activation protein [Microbulbifer salipaludis]
MHVAYSKGGNVALFSKGLLVVSVAGMLLTGSEVSAQDGDSGFRSRVRQAFEQDVPHINDTDVSEEFERRAKEARDPNLDTDIPEVSGREIGPRISVKKFRFHRLEEYPEFGIDRETVEAKAEALRVQYMKEDKIVAAGYTVENLQEIALLLEGMGARFAPENLGARELRKLINTLERQNAQRGLSYVDLEDIAAELTRFYRQQGLFLAQVQIPAQEVQGGVVTFSVQEGVLGQVAVHDNQKYSATQLADAFSSQQGKLVNHDSIEESLYLLNDLPALNVAGYFSPGDNPGETRLNLKVRDESGWRLVTRMDNHGSTFTGDNRIFTAVDWFNPLGIGDELTVGYLKSSGIDEFDSGFGSNLGQLKYSLPLLSTRTRIQLSADYNKFKIHNSANEDDFINLLELEGINENYGLSVDHKFRRSRDFNITGTVTVTDKKSEMMAATPILERWDQALGGEAGIYVDHLSGGGIPMLNVINAKIQYGELNSYTGDTSLETDSEFQKFAAETSSLLFLPMPLTDLQSRLVVKSRWQYSDNTLPSFEQLSLGGANGVRAFDVRDFSADQAGLISAEWYPSFPESINPKIFGNRLNDMLQVAVIADAGYGIVNNPEEDLNNDWAALAGAGFLFKFSWAENWASQLSVAWPTSSKSSIEGAGDDADSPTLYADFSYFLQ